MDLINKINSHMSIHSGTKTKMGEISIILDKEINYSLLSKMFLQSFNDTLHKININLTGDDYLHYAKQAFENYTSLLNLNEEQREEGWKYFLTD